MPNPFYTAMMGQNSILSMIQNLYGMLPQFKANPMGYLMQRKMNVPANIANNPDAILQHLVSTGQVDPSRVEMAKSRIETAKQEIFKMGGLNNYGR